MYSVAQLWRYPVKSMQGELVHAAGVDEQGVTGDRGRALIDAWAGKVASGSWAARRWADLVAWSASYVQEPRAGRPLPEVVIDPPDGQRLVTGTSGIDELLSQKLGREVRLATAGTEEAGVMYGNPPPGTFWDVGHLHVLTTASLDRLSSFAPTARFDARRFRPNLVIDTADEVGFPEDAWLGRTLRLGEEVRLRVTSGCPRCVMTTHAQAELPKDGSILRTAARFNDANVGVYAEVVAPGVVCSGDRVELLDDAAVSAAG